jgi:hypothetical protein
MNWFFILIIAVFAIYQYRKYDGKPFPYFLGSMVLLAGIFFIEPSPDPLSFGAYCLWKGIPISTMNASNISNVLWEYEIWSIPLGIILVLAGMYLLKLDWKTLWKKLDIGHYKIALSIAILVVLTVSILDIWSAHSGVFGSYLEYTMGNYTDGWWYLFFKFVLVIFLIPAICYYFLVNRDKSESLGIFLFSLITYFGGLADIGYFIFQKIPLPSELPWLVGSPFIGFVSTKLMGLSTVTNTSLLVSVFLSFIIAWIVAKVLKEKF